MKVTLTSNDINQLELCWLRLKCYFIKENIKFSGPISLPTTKTKYCLLRSPHVNKDSREHLEIFLYKKFFYIKYQNYINLKIYIPTEIQINFKIIN